MTSAIDSVRVTPALPGPGVRVIGAVGCLFLLCSCATAPNWNADDSIRPPLPAETSLNKGAGRGEHIRVTLHLKSGQEIPVMMDTGSPDTMLDKSLNPQLGKRLGKETFRFPAMKKGTAAVYRPPELYLGGTQLLVGKKVLTIDWNGGAGILGMDCLRHYCLQLDFTAGKLRFLDPDHLKTEELGQGFPLTISPWTRHVKVREDFLGAKGAKWMIDTGLNVDGVLKGKLFERELGAQHISAAPGEINGAKGVGACFPEAEFRGATYTNLIVAEMPRKMPLPNLIGLQFLARHLVTFNFPKRMMYLKRTSAGPLIDTNNSTNAAPSIGRDKRLKTATPALPETSP